MTSFASSFASWVLGYLLNSLWQVPLVFAAAWIAAWLARPLGSRMEHRVWVGALILQAILPICQFQVAGFLQRAWGLVLSIFGNAAGGGTRVIISAAAAAPMAAFKLPSWVIP